MRTVRRVAAIVTAAVGVLTVAPASGAQAAPAASVRPSCRYGEIGGTGNLAAIPNATRPRQKVWATATVRNTGAGALSGVFFDYEIAAPSNAASPAPDVWWHVVGGPWHWMKLSWYPAVRGGSDAFWVSSWDAQLGNLAGRATVKAQFSINYPAGARSGTYNGTLLVGARSCGSQLLGGDIPVVTSYRVH